MAACRAASCATSSEDTGFKLDQGVAIFKKIMAVGEADVLLRRQHAVGEGGRAGRDRLEPRHDLVDFARDRRRRPEDMPQHFVPGPTYPRLHEILMEYIARSARRRRPSRRSPTSTPTPSSAATAFPAARRAPRSSACRSSPRSSPSSPASTSRPRSPSCAAPSPTSSSSRATSWRRCPSSSASCARPA